MSPSGGGGGGGGRGLGRQGSEPKTHYHATAQQGEKPPLGPRPPHLQPQQLQQQLQLQEEGVSRGESFSSGAQKKPTRRTPFTTRRAHSLKKVTPTPHSLCGRILLLLVRQSATIPFGSILFVMLLDQPWGAMERKFNVKCSC